MIWWLLPDSNWGHKALQASALPTELKSHVYQGIIPQQPRLFNYGGFVRKLFICYYIGMNNALPRNNSIWKTTLDVINTIYESTNSFDVDLSNEKLTFVNKYKYAAEDALHYVAIAVGGGAGTNLYNDYDWIYARRYIFNLQSQYLFACKQDYAVLDEEIIIVIDGIIKDIDKEILSCNKLKEVQFEDELLRLKQKAEIQKLAKAN